MKPATTGDAIPAVDVGIVGDGQAPALSAGRLDAPPSPDCTPKVSGSARRQAGVILEVLGGVRTPQEAAALLEVSEARYYLLESRAVAGLVAACEPRPRGPQVDYAEKWRREREQVASLKQEVTRLTALLRTAQQAYGVKPVPADRQRQAQAARKAGKRAKRKPGVRALKARERLEEAPTDQRPAGGAEKSSPSCERGPSQGAAPG